MSLLPALASATHISVPAAGQYISAYAAGVVLGAPLMAILGARWPRKRLLYCLLLIALLGYIGSALAWSYSSLMAARFISGLPHGAWYGVAGLAASVMVTESKRTQYIGYVMLGLAAANVIGVPAMTWLGQQLGWRAAFSFVAAGVIATAVLLYFFIPVTPASRDASPLKELSALLKPQVWYTLAVATVGFGGMFAVYSYITPTLTEVSNFTLSEVPAVLILWGRGWSAAIFWGGDGRPGTDPGHLRHAVLESAVSRAVCAGRAMEVGRPAVPVPAGERICTGSGITKPSDVRRP